MKRIIETFCLGLLLTSTEAFSAKYLRYSCVNGENETSGLARLESGIDNTDFGFRLAVRGVTISHALSAAKPECRATYLKRSTSILNSKVLKEWRADDPFDGKDIYYKWTRIQYTYKHTWASISRNFNVIRVELNRKKEYLACTHLTVEEEFENEEVLLASLNPDFHFGTCPPAPTPFIGKEVCDERELDSLNEHTTCRDVGASPPEYRDALCTETIEPGCVEVLL